MINHKGSLNQKSAKNISNAHILSLVQSSTGRCRRDRAKLSSCQHNIPILKMLKPSDIKLRSIISRKKERKKERRFARQSCQELTSDSKFHHCPFYRDVFVTNATNYRSAAIKFVSCRTRKTNRCLKARKVKLMDYSNGNFSAPLFETRASYSSFN